MNYIETKLKRGSEKDIFILLFSVVVLGTSFSFLYKTEFWEANQYSWKSLAIIGATGFSIYFFRRLFGRKFNIRLIEKNEDNLIFRTVNYINMSGWVEGSPIELHKSKIKTAKFISFYNTATHTGMSWVCFITNENQAIEYRLSDEETVKKIKSFTKEHIPEVDIVEEEKN
jgi:hypothetical protein